MMELKTNGSSDGGLDILETLYYLYKKKIIILTSIFFSLILALALYQYLPNKYVGSISINELSSVQNPFNDIIDSKQIKKTFIYTLNQETEFTNDEIVNLHSISKSNLDSDSVEFLNLMQNSYAVGKDVMIVKGDSIAFIKEMILLKLIDANNKVKKNIIKNLAYLIASNDEIDIKFSYQDQIIDMILDLEEKFEDENIFLELTEQDPRNSILSNLVSQILIEAYKNNYEGSANFVKYDNALKYFLKEEVIVVNYSMNKIKMENLKYSFVYIMIIFSFIGFLSSIIFILVHKEFKNRNFS